MNHEMEATLAENNPTLAKLLFSVVGMIDRNGLVKIVSTDEKYFKFTGLLLELREAVREARETKNIPVLVESKFK